MSIVALLNQISADEIVLPAIQRSFVWPEDNIFKLLDSIMRGYPLGITLLWESYDDIQYRKFSKDYKSDNVPVLHGNSQKRKLKLVLDGQQRLQSLYIALYGTFESKYLYFDVFSGEDTDDSAEIKYWFWFYTSVEADKFNNEIIGAVADLNLETPEDLIKEHYVKVADLFAMGVREKLAFKQELTQKLNLSTEESIRLDLNLSRFSEAFSQDANLLRVSTIDENLPADSPYRKSELDVLEIFVRINQQVMKLNRSDLIFSMLKLNFKESAQALPEFMREINQNNSFELDEDFVIRCLFVVSGLGSKLDVDVLRKRSNADKVRQNFDQCCDSIRAAVDFLQKECWCSSSDVLGGKSNLVPLVYYLFHAPKHQVPNSQISNVRKAVYLFGFTRLFSRYADSRINSFIKSSLQPLVKANDSKFPIKDVIGWIGYWEKIREFSDDLIAGNPKLAMHLVQELSGAKTKYKGNSPEIDHIFPRSELRKKGFDELLINHYANFWLLAKGKNQNKTNKRPCDYFADVEQAELERALISRELLNYGRYKSFLKDRSARILNKIQDKLQFSKGDFVTKNDFMDED